MELNAMVTVDLQNSDCKQAALFEQEMLNRQWVKYPGKFTAFCTTIQGDDLTDQQVVELAEFDMQEAAKAAGIEDWDGICMLAHHKRRSCNIDRNRATADIAHFRSRPFFVDLRDFAHTRLINSLDPHTDG